MNDSPKLNIRRANQSDIAEIAHLFRRVRQACLPYLPDLHTPDEDLWFFREKMFRECDVWLAERDGLVGFCGYRTGWVDHLYLQPNVHRRGIGTQLLAHAKAGQSELRLWVFQRNRPAIHFYLANGFRLVEETDGIGNEEREPDALYLWSAQQPVSG